MNMGVGRVKTGVPALNRGCKSLDDIIGGGVPEGTIVVVSGPNGSGKTILTLQYVVSGALAGEKGIYFSFNQRREDILAQGACFGWDIEMLENDGNMLLKIYNIVSDSPTSVRRDIEKTIETYRPKRVVVDSISMYTLFMEMAENLGVMMGYDLEHKDIHFNRELLMRLSVLKLFDTLKSNKTTTLITSESACESTPIIIDSISQFIADGVVSLKTDECREDGFGTLQVEELRLTAHSRRLYQTHITDEGLKLGLPI